MQDRRSSYHIGNRIPRNPFDSIQIIKYLEWCKNCKMDVDTEVESANAQGVDVYRKRCKRCGNVMQYGIAKRDILGSKSLPQKAIEFIKKTGKDRR